MANAKKLYVAEWSDGVTIYRKSTREYGAAWRVVTESGDTIDSGFARDLELARRSAAAATRRTDGKLETMVCREEPLSWEREYVKANPWILKTFSTWQGQTIGRVYKMSANMIRRFPTYEAGRDYATTHIGNRQFEVIHKPK